MERIGIAASKIAKGNLYLYNLYVILIAFLFSLFLFFISGCSVILSLIIIGYAIDGIIPTDLSKDWGGIMRVCMVSLTVLISFVNLFAIMRNIKFHS